MYQYIFDHPLDNTRDRKAEAQVQKNDELWKHEVGNRHSLLARVREAEAKSQDLEAKLKSHNDMNALLDVISCMKAFGSSNL